MIYIQTEGRVITRLFKEDNIEYGTFVLRTMSQFSKLWTATLNKLRIGQEKVRKLPDTMFPTDLHIMFKASEELNLDCLALLLLR